ncbi:uncharacterized protein LOC18425945 isoform X2 [Amborella trichopoda]|uniref:uncharacterized protein LOC18425945 isoform X2 n=1 Tax=Amborella trichopoda TaxID=13333 RepID=UPI0009C09EB6|nr:uncharacterized protein LOC18425945 isoform X2 [Amborella trichopoda]|eukprot:XP_020517900.1 uncharacterized protein LOC18425945 isoform X2 [Amborella trichopoda]
MAYYIPPHKRNTKDTENSTSSPSSLIPQLEESLNLGTWYAGSSGHSSGNLKRDMPKRYSKDSISRSWHVGMSHAKEESGHNTTLEPWLHVAEKIQPDLISAFQTVKSQMAFAMSEELKLLLTVRFGKILFYGGTSSWNNSINLDMIRKSLEGEGESNKVHKTFYGNVPEEYVKAIECQAIPKLGLLCGTIKEKYYLKIYDKMQGHANLTCKCTKRLSGSVLELQKIETNPLRHLVVDISCLGKNVDLQLILAFKKISTELTEEEIFGIYELVNSAVIDPNVKGKLRWPLKKEGTGDRFSIRGVWHTESKYFQGQTMKLKLRHVYRNYDKHSTGQVSWEVNLEMQEITRLLMDQMLDGNKVAVEKLQEALKFIWEEFLSC